MSETKSLEEELIDQSKRAESQVDSWLGESYADFSLDRKISINKETIRRSGVTPHDIAVWKDHAKVTEPAIRGATVIGQQPDHRVLGNYILALERAALDSLAQLAITAVTTGMRNPNYNGGPDLGIRHAIYAAQTSYVAMRNLVPLSMMADRRAPDLTSLKGIAEFFTFGITDYIVDTSRYLTSQTFGDGFSYLEHTAPLATIGTLLWGKVTHPVEAQTGVETSIATMPDTGGAVDIARRHTNKVWQIMHLTEQNEKLENEQVRRKHFNQLQLDSPGDPRLNYEKNRDISHEAAVKRAIDKRGESDNAIEVVHGPFTRSKEIAKKEGVFIHPPQTEEDSLRSFLVIAGTTVGSLMAIARYGPKKSRIVETLNRVQSRIAKFTTRADISHYNDEGLNILAKVARRKDIVAEAARQLKDRAVTRSMARAAANQPSLLSQGIAAAGALVGLSDVAEASEQTAEPTLDHTSESALTIETTQKRDDLNKAEIEHHIDKVDAHHLVSGVNVSKVSDRKRKLEGARAEHVAAKRQETAPVAMPDAAMPSTQADPSGGGGGDGGGGGVPGGMEQTIETPGPKEGQCSADDPITGQCLEPVTPVAPVEPIYPVDATKSNTTQIPEPVEELPATPSSSVSTPSSTSSSASSSSSSPAPELVPIPARPPGSKVPRNETATTRRTGSRAPRIDPDARPLDPPSDSFPPNSDPSARPLYPPRKSFPADLDPEGRPLDARRDTFNTSETRVVQRMATDVINKQIEDKEISVTDDSHKSRLIAKIIDEAASGSMTPAMTLNLHRAIRSSDLSYKEQTALYTILMDRETTPEGGDIEKP